MRREAWRMLALLWAIWPGAVLASSPRPKAINQVQALVPKGWSNRTDLPEGIVAMFLGPRSPEGQVVVTIGKLKAGAWPGSAAFSELPAALSADPQPGTLSTGPFAAPQIDRREGALQVRQWIVPGPVSYLVTVAAPEALFEDAVRKVLKAAAELQLRGEKKASAPPLDPRPTPTPPTGLDTKSTTRPDEEPLAGKGSAD